MQLQWHSYKYYPYEKELAKREANALLLPENIQEQEGGIHIQNPARIDSASRLAYFSKAYTDDNQNEIVTSQSVLERVNGNGIKRQSTRYSAHGLHEYKGKFNPQVVKALLNIFGAEPGKRVLDPFCGSGTSLVECAHLNISAVGTDINPFATFVANTKIGALGIKASRIEREFDKILARAKRSRNQFRNVDERGDYLKKWFPQETYLNIERLRNAIVADESDASNILLAIASNILREYSNQEPQDLRIRKRKSPFPLIPFYEAYEKAVKKFCYCLRDSQQALGLNKSDIRALTFDCRLPPENERLIPENFDLAITSPPYATALPYVDTQRLSIVWLDMLDASKVSNFESRLIGSREIRGKKRSELVEIMNANIGGLPNNEFALCAELLNSLKPSDGFRRQAVPILLYRYFSEMGEAFSRIHKLMKPNAPFGLIVGGNHTILGGKRFDIDTAAHLVNIAVKNGWSHTETVPLQTYQRFGLHMNNATSSEALIILNA